MARKPVQAGNPCRQSISVYRGSVHREVTAQFRVIKCKSIKVGQYPQFHTTDFGIVDLMTFDFFQWAPCTSIRRHSFKLYNNNLLHVSDPHFSVSALLMYGIVDFSSLRSFTCTFKLADLSLLLKCYNQQLSSCSVY